MGAPVEMDSDAGVVDVDGGGHVDQVAEDLPGLGVSVAAHATRDEPIEAAGDDQQSHVEVDLEPDRGRERVHVEEADGRGPPLHEEGSQRLVLPLLRGPRLLEKALTLP